MPKMSEPDTVRAPWAGTSGRETMRPLLSWGKSHTGFCSWLWSGTDATEQPEAGQLKYTAGTRDTGPLHALPQSWRNTPSPIRPLAPRAETLSAAVPPLAQSEGTAAKPGALMIWIGTAADSVSALGANGLM